MARTTVRRPATARPAPKKTKALVAKVTKVKADDASPPRKAVSTKAHPRKAALADAKTPVGAKPAVKAARDTAAAKRRDHALTGRSQLNFRG